MQTRLGIGGVCFRARDRDGKRIGRWAHHAAHAARLSLGRP
jgi:hypothetical protein